jgi:integrase
MAQQQISPGSINAAIAALRFFFTATLERPDLVRPLTTVNKPRQAPVVLSQEEVARLLEAAPGLKYKAALSVAYGAGLRVSEVANLKVSDIDSQPATSHGALPASSFGRGARLGRKGLSSGLRLPRRWLSAPLASLGGSLRSTRSRSRISPPASSSPRPWSPRSFSSPASAIASANRSTCRSSRICS